LALAIGVLATVLPAAAHPKADYYQGVWRQDLVVDWRFTDNVPTGNFRDRVEDGSQEWNQLPPDMRFNRAGEIDDYPFASCGPGGDGTNGFHWGNIDGQGGTWGQTYVCVYSADPDRLYSSQIRLDKNEDWYSGTGDVPGDKIDTKGAAAHEFGHATGFAGPYSNGHFNPNGSECEDAKQTMCPSMNYGQEFMRSLEEHDRHTFGNAY
jgi:hypothetical protein